MKSKETFATKFLNWCDKYRWLILLVGTLVSGGITLATKRYSAKNAVEYRKKEVWDASLGTWWQLKRPLTNAEKMQLQNAKQNGVSIGDALKQMGVLK